MAHARDAGRGTPHLWLTATAYAALTVVATWPLATRLGTSLAGDYGDSLYVAWVMAWVGDHLRAVLSGDLSAWGAMWQAPIFAPVPDALTFSEHFLGQAAQGLPVLWLSGNPLLAYNVVFLATIALTGFFAHQLSYHLTHHHAAAAVAGVLATFNDYRFYWSLGHLHTLSIHWWLAALWALDVYVATASRRALAAATLALVALHLSSNYLMAYSAPFTVAFAVWALWRHGRLSDLDRWIGLATAGGVSVAAVVPLVMRYLATRDALDVSRTVEEIAGNSASLAAYAAATPWLGPLAGLALVGTVAPAGRGGELSRPQRWGLAGMALLAFVLSFGPVVTVAGATFTGPYLWLRDVVPGFEGLRVPHRFVTIATSLLAVLAGFGGAWLGRRRLGWLAVVVAVAFATRTAWSRAFPIDRPLDAAPLNTPAASLRPSAVAPPLYRLVATLPADAVLLELPFGNTAYEIRYTFFTRAHGHRVVNGYSGILPAGYLRQRVLLQAPLDEPDAAWEALAPATHVAVHGDAWPDDTGARLRLWLEARGARPVAHVDAAWLYALPR